MIKYILIFLTSMLIFAGCSASINTANMVPSERLSYAMKLYNDEDYEEALNEFEAITMQFPGNAVVDDAQYYLGMTRYKRHEYILAAYEFSKLIKNMPASKFMSDAQFMLADSYYQLSPNYQLDQQYTKKSIEEFQAFIDFFPSDAKVKDAEKKIKELNNKLAQKAYSIANIYEKLDYYKAALIYYDEVLDTYHDSNYAPLAMYDKIMLLIDRKQDDEALQEIAKFINRYPNNEKIDKVKDLKDSLESNLSAAK
jgi:outer membrane protein assembly factor BamD